MEVAAMTNNAEALWLHLADSKPLLRNEIDLHLHNYRGETYCLLSDAVSGDSFQIEGRFEKPLAAMNGQASAAEIQKRYSNSIDKETFAEFLLTLRENGLLQGDLGLDDETLFKRAQHKQTGVLLEAVRNPLFWRLPLFNIDKLAQGLAPYYRRLSSPVAKSLLALFLISGLTQLIAFSDELTSYAATYIGDPTSYLKIAICYFLIKSLHELSHATSCRLHGRPVGKVGLAFMLFFPVPYVDVSSSSLIVDKHGRMSVAAAGIIAELLIAFAGMQLWLFSGNELIREIGFYCLFTGGLSSLLFNGNPLLRFDGYYVFSDYLEIPNLYQRSGAYLKQRASQLLAGENANDKNHPDYGLRHYFIAYGLCSRVYRLLITFTIALYLAGKWFVIGSLLALWLAFKQLLLPLLKFGVETAPLLIQQGKQKRAIGIATVCSALLLAAVFIDVPHNIVVHGIVQVPESAALKTSSDGFVVKTMAPTGSKVKRDQMLVLMENHHLQYDISQKEAALNIADAELRIASVTDAATVQSARKKYSNLQKDLAALQEQAQGLQVSSPVDGKLTLLKAEAQPGSFHNAGKLLGTVASVPAVDVLTVLRERDYFDIKNCLQHIEVRNRYSPSSIHAAEIKQLAEEANFELPSRRFATINGGDIRVDQRAPENTKSLEPFFQAILTSTIKNSRPKPGQSLAIKFYLCHQSLAEKALDSLFFYISRHD
jgi:putative peptide zinc metalloprotease protein